jgi:phosphate:Na+ symporter
MRAGGVGFQPIARAFRRGRVPQARILAQLGEEFIEHLQSVGPADVLRVQGDVEIAAAAVFMTEDPRAARQLLGEKEVFRELELRTTEEYFGRARNSRAETIEMSKLLLDIVRDLKRVNAHLAAAAYPILEGRGELLPSRLKQDL